MAAASAAREAISPVLVGADRIAVDQISLLAIPLLAVLGAGAGPAEMGYLTAAGLIPNLLFSLLAGAWIDRYPHRRRLMIIADLGRAAADRRAGNVPVRQAGS